MGFFFSNLHVRKTSDFSTDDFRAVLAEILRRQGFSSASSPEDADLSLSIYDGGETWISVCADGVDFYTEQSIRGICRPLSDQMAADVLTISCFDSDCLLLNLINTHSGTDAWAKVGKYPGLRIRSKPAKWHSLIEDVSKFKALLSKPYTFAEDSLEAIEPLLGLAHWQGRFCEELLSEERFAGKIQTFYYSLPETARKAEPPRLTIPCFDRMPCKMGESRIIRAANTGGRSTGLAVAFSGSYVEKEEIQFHDVQLEYAFDRTPRPTIPLRLEKTQTQDGQWIFYAEIPQFQIPSGVKEGLPARRAMDEEFKRSFGLRFTPEGNARKRLDITLHFIPLKNPAGQCAWCVWLYSGNKRKFVEEFNETWRAIQAPGVELLNIDELDLS